MKTSSLGKRNNASFRLRCSEVALFEDEWCGQRKNFTNGKGNYVNDKATKTSQPSGVEIRASPELKPKKSTPVTPRTAPSISQKERLYICNNERGEKRGKKRLNSILHVYRLFSFRRRYYAISKIDAPGHANS